MAQKNSVLSDALNDILVMSGYIIEFDLTNMLSAWDKCKKHYGSKIKPVPKAAHMGVLETDYVERNSKKLSRLARHYRDKYKDLINTDLRGKFENKVPHIDYPEGMTLATKAEVHANVAGIVLELFIDNGVYTCRTEKKKRNSKEVVTIIELGEEDEPVDLLEGVCDEPGEMIQKKVGFERLNTYFQDLLRAIASWAWCISDYMTDELIRHGYQLSAEYNAVTPKEKSAHRIDRHDVKYIEAIGELRRKKKFYLPMFFDYRGRLNYYFAKVFGVRPGGKLWETLALDRFKGKVLSESAVKHLKHIIYTVRHGKYSVKHALKHFKDEDYEYARTINPLDVPIPVVPYGDKGQNAEEYKRAEAEFGNRILLNKCAIALGMYEAGIPCKFIFGKDLTNSGLMMAACSFLSEKMLRAVNLWGLNKVTDSHMVFGIAHKIAHMLRDYIKDIHTPLIHGSCAATIVRKLKQHGENPDDYTVDGVEKHNVDAYGIEVKNIGIITKFGEEHISNDQNILKFKSGDMFPACHKAISKRVPFVVYVASPRTDSKKGCIEYSCVQSMPVALDAKGDCIYGYENTTKYSTKGVDPGIWGLFANITHSIDGYGLRWVIWMLIEAKEQGLFKHDDYMVSPDMFDSVIDTLQSFFMYLQRNNLYVSALEQISKKLHKPAKAPKLYQGKAANKVSESLNFLM